MKKQIFCIISAALLVSACDSRNFGKNGSKGPDEFSVIPTKPLEDPESFDVLPEPTPGQPNRVDKQPDRDAVAALGGDPARLHDGRIKGGEQALLATASRYGVDPDIRSKVKKEDEILRKKKKPRLLERLADTGFLRPYKDSILDADTEATRLKRRGVQVPNPPKPAEE